MKIEEFVARGQRAQAEVDAAVLRAEARLRADRACELIERAQHDLERACAELSALIGGIPVWKRTGKLADQARALWYRVDGFRSGGRYQLDSTNVAALKRRAAEQREIEEHAERQRDCGDAAQWDSDGVRR